MDHSPSSFSSHWIYVLNAPLAIKALLLYIITWEFDHRQPYPNTYADISKPYHCLDQRQRWPELR